MKRTHRHVNRRPMRLRHEAQRQRIAPSSCPAGWLSGSPSRSAARSGAIRDQFGQVPNALPEHQREHYTALDDA